MYFGECCDPYGEFPIEVADGHLSRRDRGYWTHGFHLRDLRLSSEDSSESLQQDEGLLGLLADVYVCGKSVHLLHLCTTAKVRFWCINLFNGLGFISWMISFVSTDLNLICPS